MWFSFSRQFKKLASRLSNPNEVNLFRCLIDAINGSAYCYGSMAKEKHQNYVKFKSQKFLNNTTYKVEIADVLMIFVGNNNIRYTFMQNKKNALKSNNILRINPIQWDLLYSKPTIDPLNTGLPKDILCSAVLDSAGTYGDFFFSNNHWDMSYYIATEIIPNKSIISPTSRSLRSFRIKSTKRMILKKNNFKEINRTEHLDCFEHYAQKMLVGTPVFVLNKENGELSFISPSGKAIVDISYNLYNKMKSENDRKRFSRSFEETIDGYHKLIRNNDYQKESIKKINCFLFDITKDSECCHHSLHYRWDGLVPPFC